MRTCCLPHPGEFIRPASQELFDQGARISGKKLASHTPTLTRKSAVNPDGHRFC